MLKLHQKGKVLKCGLTDKSKRIREAKVICVYVCINMYEYYVHIIVHIQLFLTYVWERINLYLYSYLLSTPHCNHLIPPPSHSHNSFGLSLYHTNACDFKTLFLQRRKSHLQCGALYVRMCTYVGYIDLIGENRLVFIFLPVIVFRWRR